MNKSVNREIIWMHIIHFPVHKFPLHSPKNLLLFAFYRYNGGAQSRNELKIYKIIKYFTTFKTFYKSRKVDIMISSVGLAFFSLLGRFIVHPFPSIEELLAYIPPPQVLEIFLDSDIWGCYSR